MKKSVFIMLLTLIVLCFIYSASETQASPSSVSASEPLKKVIDIEESEESPEEEEDTDSSEKTTDKKTDSASGVFNKSGREAVDGAMSGSGMGIMSDDYEFGDQTLPDVDTEGFFQHVYNKLWEATTGLQKVFSVISVMFFLVSLIMVLISSLGDRRHLGWYLFSLLISCLVFIGALYAPQIVAAFSNWFVN